MGRRSAGNPRYRKDAEIGKTRRSAASAKPKREAGEAPTRSGSSAGKGSGGKGGKGKVDWSTVVPDTPEYKRLRIAWLTLLIVAMVASVGGYFLREQQTIGSVALALAYAALFGAFGIDFLKIRPMRKAWVEEKQAGGKKKESSDEGKA